MNVLRMRPAHHPQELLAQHWERIRSVLVLMPDKHLGNLVLALPAIRALRELFSNRQVRLLVDSRLGQVTDLVWPRHELLHYPHEKIRRGPWLRRPGLFVRLVRAVRGVAPDLVIDLKGGNTTAILAWASGARWRIGREGMKMEWCLTHRVQASARRHVLESYLAIPRALGAATLELKPIVLPPPPTRLLAGLLLEAGVDPSAPVVCIHPGAGKDYKLWPASHFAAVVDWLTERGLQPVLIGTAKDRRRIDEVCSQARRPVADLGERLTVNSLMGLLQTSKLYIGSDSGPMHLAALAGTPIVAIFGPSDDRAWHPVSPRAIWLRGPERCVGCPRQAKCTERFKCLTSLQPGMVTEAAQKLVPELLSTVTCEWTDASPRP
jgi:heptosyltransferase III